MEERQMKRIIIPDSGYTVYYSEQEVAEYCQVEVHMLRRLHAVGLIEGIEMVGEERRYSEKDADRLGRIPRLHRGLGVNPAELEIILRLPSPGEPRRLALLALEVARPGKPTMHQPFRA